MVKTLAAWAVLVLFVLPSGSVGATTVRPLSLQEMVDLSDRIFVGTVVEVREGKDEKGLSVTYITFAVSRALKGSVPGNLRIKQLGRKTPDEKGSVFRVPGMPTYREGEELLLFLHGDSRSGFTSPVGLGQGKFKITRKKSRAFVVDELKTGRLDGQEVKEPKEARKKAKNEKELEEFVSTLQEMMKATPKGN